VLAPNVRGSTGYGKTYRDLDNGPRRVDSVKDAKAAADWLVAEGLADPRRIAVQGGSYGGYMVLALLAEHPDTFAAGAESVGIANFETFLENTAPYRRALREAEYGPLSDRALLRSLSPIHKVAAIRAPLLIAQGVNDPRVPVGEARQMEAELRRLGRPVEAIYFANEGHGWRRPENRVLYQRTLAAFFSRWLSP
jgi:dipeptidyl aminopeptidase/acylaminoacyl peptidase